MPAVSSYLSDEIFEHVKDKAKTVNMSISRYIREAVENYLAIEKKKKARGRVLKMLSEQKPLGGDRAWEEIHRERTNADRG